MLAQRQSAKIAGKVFLDEWFVFFILALFRLFVMGVSGTVSTLILIEPLYVFFPVENAVAPAAESVIIDE